MSKRLVRTETVPRPRLILLRVLAVTAGVEFVVMTVISLLGIQRSIWAGVIDGLLLAVISAPFLLAWVVRPVTQLLSLQTTLNLVQGLDAILWEADAKTLELSFVSQRAEEILGYPVELWLTKRDFWANLIHPEDRERAIAFRQTVGLSGRDHEVDYRVVAADGRVVWLRDIVRVIRDETGRPRWLRGLMIDVTARKRDEESLGTLSAAVEQTAESVVITNANGVIEYVNRAFEEQTGYTKEGVIGKTPRVLKSGKHDQRFYEALWETILAGETFSGVLINKYKNGALHYEEKRITPIRDGEGHITHFVSTGRDITDQLQAKESLRETSGKMKTLLETIPDAVYFKDGEGRWILVNPTGLRLFELEGVPYQGRAEAELAEIRPFYRDALLTCARTDEEAWGRRGLSVKEEVISKPDGASVTLETIKVPLFNDDGSRKGLVVVGRDITERKWFESRLAYLADRDALTGLFNRHRFQEEAERELAQARRYGTRGAVMFLDLDDFKDVNDSFGHQEGDKLLRGLADLLRKRLRETDILARLGGDEFAILLSHTGTRQAQEVADQILEGVGRHAILVGGKSIGITVSIGIALYPEHGTTVEELLAHADVAMYRAKEHGGNGAWVYMPDPGGQAQMESRLSWKRRIREALDKDLFVLHGQPILDLRSNRISHHELLLRMVGDGGEVIPPGSFLGIAERFGLIHLIDRWVVCRAIRIIAEHRKVGQDLCLTANLSGRAFEDKELPAMIRRELAENAIDPARLVLEITETAAVADINQAQAFVDLLKGLGCQFALDDFGVGFSSFYHLKHLRVDYLKIDGSFIRNLAHDAVDQHVVKAMVDVAHALGKRTVAEFVGDEETVRLLREYGADYAQGYHIGPPRTVSEVLSNVVDKEQY